jgi:hypothetical protein
MFLAEPGSSDAVANATQIYLHTAKQTAGYDLNGV